MNFYLVEKQFEKEYPYSSITKHLASVNNEDWFKYLNGARNRVEHGQIPRVFWHV
jgi:hypothetical protein